MKYLINYQEFKNYFFKKENIYFFLIIFLLFIADRFSKMYVINNFSDNVYFVSNFINVDLIWNTGIAFGLLSLETPLFYKIVSFLIGMVILIIFYNFIIFNNLYKFPFSIILGGALGNFYDRLILGAVPDFIDIHYNNFHWFTFNLADIFIILGIIIFLVQDLFKKKSK